MCDVNGRESHLLLDITQLHADAFTQLGIQVGQRFIQKQELRIHDERSGDSDTLLLSAGHLVREALFHPGELHQRERFGDALLDLLCRFMLDTKAIGDVLKYIHVREERVFLKHHRRIAVVRRYTLDVLVI